MPADVAPKPQRRRALLIAALAFVVAYVLWNVPALDPLTYPLRLFVTYVHEAGHSLAALVTGGQVIGFTVSPDGSGLATTAGGWRPLVISGGYLGAALFGSLLFVLVNRASRYADGIAVLLGLGLGAFTVLYARPDETGSLVAFLVGLGFALALVLMGWKAPNLITVLVLNVLALMTALNAVLDIWYVFQNSDAARGAVSNDAAAFSREVAPLLSAQVVALLWAGIAVLMLVGALWLGVWKPLRREIDAALGQSNAA